MKRCSGKRLTKTVQSMVRSRLKTRMMTTIRAQVDMILSVISQMMSLRIQRK